MRTTRSFPCQTQGCEGYALFWITTHEPSDNGDRDHQRNKHVCMACRDEMTSLYGWSLLDWGKSR